MANQIRLTPEELRELASKLLDCASSVNENMKNINQVLDQLNSYWSGDTLHIYTCQIREDQERLHKLQENLENLAAVANQAASSMEETDYAFTSFFACND